MTLQEKLIFLAKRAEDGKEFYIVGTEKCRGLYAIKEGKLYCLFPDRESVLTLNRMTEREFQLKPQWSFTDDEKAILRNLPEEYKWIARDGRDSAPYVYSSKPIKNKVIKHWINRYKDGTHSIGRSLEIYKHIFQSIQWSDDEPCEFRKYI